MKMHILPSVSWLVSFKMEPNVITLTGGRWARKKRWSCHFFREEVGVCVAWHLCVRDGKYFLHCRPACSCHPCYRSICLSVSHAQAWTERKSMRECVCVWERTWFVCGCPVSDWWAAKAHKLMLIRSGRLPGCEGCVGMSSPPAITDQVFGCLLGRKSLLMWRRRLSLSSFRHSRPHTRTLSQKWLCHRCSDCGSLVQKKIRCARLMQEETDWELIPAASEVLK